MKDRLSVGGRVISGYLSLGGAIVLLIFLVTGKLQNGVHFLWIDLEPGIVPVVLDLLLFYWGIRLLSGAPIRRMGP